MLSSGELREIAKMRGEGAYFVSLYLNVNPMTNVKNNYVIHVKNMLKDTAEKLDKAVMKKITGDLEKIDSYILTNKRVLKKGLAILSSQEKKFWKEFHLSVPLKNEIIDGTLISNHCLISSIIIQEVRHSPCRQGIGTAIRVHLGETEEYTEVHSADARKVKHGRLVCPLERALRIRITTSAFT
jgi:hypothetical protein